MVSYRFLTLAALALPFLAAAAPTVSETQLEIRAPAEVFSFEKWVDSIVANPDTALSPEQAIEAWKVSTNGTAASEASSLSKRSCVAMADQAYVCHIPFPTYLPSFPPSKPPTQIVD